MLRRINFYAGPGAGKSTLAARTFAELKIRGYDVEHIPEYIKTWAYMGRKPKSYDQLYVYAKQLHTEDAALQHCKHIVTDSPLLMNNAYASYYGCAYTDHMVQLSQAFDRDFPAINFYIDRSVEYVQHGRYQDLAQAKEFDDFLKDFLSKHLKGWLVHVQVENFDRIMELIEEGLSDSKVA